ncbi:MAG: hypothetical protein ACHQK8_00470 [Bacteroidia bacterium]
MKNLKIVFVALLTIAGNMGMAQAPYQQTAKTAEKRATEHSNHLKVKLGLTPDQQKNVYDLCLQRTQQEDADRAKFNGDRKALRSARMQNEQNFEASLFKVLTPDQKAKFEQMKEQRKEKRGMGGRGGRGGE